MHQCNSCSRHQVVVRHLPQIDNCRHFAKAKTPGNVNYRKFTAYQGKVVRPKFFPVAQEVVIYRNKPCCLLPQHLIPYIFATAKPATSCTRHRNVKAITVAHGVHDTYLIQRQRTSDTTTPSPSPAIAKEARTTRSLVILPLRLPNK